MSLSNRIWSKIPQILRDRPFGIYVSTLVFGLGVYGLTNSEDIAVTGLVGGVAMVVISIYLICASVIVISSLVVDRHKYPAFAIFGEMYGWLFICAAALSTALLIPLQSFALDNPPDAGLIWLLTFLWFMLFVASAVRSLDILVTNRGHLR